MTNHIKSLGKAALLTLTLTLTCALAQPGVSAATPAPTAAAVPMSSLTNLAHLDFLTEQVAVPDSTAHSSYRLATEPTVGVLWVYADANPDGSFTKVGGGPYDAATNTYSQGAFDADDIARAAVVYLRQWRATGDTKAKEQAYQQLRGLSYLQTLTGPSAGEVVLWMQPDGTLNPSPTPVELPDPSDSGPSYWLARTLWALGEGYAAFEHTDREFAAFLKSRMDLAVAALHRDVLGDYRSYQLIHGVRVPAWLIVDGADASSEAVLGLAAYVQATGDRRARAALTKLAHGIAAMSDGSPTSWPYRALLPWALSRSQWHAWGSNMSVALAAAATVLGEQNLLKPAISDTAGFSAQLLTSTGPINGMQPTPTDITQIAYGADARVQGLFAVGTASHRPGIRQLAGIAAGWFFGQNASGAAVYDPATGVTRDGVQGDGTVNNNSGAESTIHGLLTMQVLDANPDLAALARSAAAIHTRNGLSVVEAESGTLRGQATVITPASAWTGESLWSGSYVAAGPGSTIDVALAADVEPRLIQPVVELAPGSAARSTVNAGRTTLGKVRFGDVGAQGNAPSPTELKPIELNKTIGPGAVTVSISTTGGTGNIDALLVMPEIATLAADGGGHAVTLMTSKSGTAEHRTITVAGTGPATVTSYDKNGRQLSQHRSTSTRLTVGVAAGGFTITVR
ncbi:MAG: hypothetical protein ABWZ02_02655 [Nakamurella sp.]